MGSSEVGSARAKGALLVATKEAREEAFGNGGGFIESWNEDGCVLASNLVRLARQARLDEEQTEHAVETLARISRYLKKDRDNVQAKPTLAEIRLVVESEFIANSAKSEELREAALRGYLEGSGYPHDGGASFARGVRDLLVWVATDVGNRHWRVREMAAKAVARGAPYDDQLC